MSDEEQKKPEGEEPTSQPDINFEAVMAPLGSGIVPRRLLVTPGRTINELMRLAREDRDAEDI